MKSLARPLDKYVCRGPRRTLYLYQVSAGTAQSGGPSRGWSRRFLINFVIPIMGSGLARTPYYGRVSMSVDQTSFPDYHVSEHRVLHTLLKVVYARYHALHSFCRFFFMLFVASNLVGFPRQTRISQALTTINPLL